MIKTIRKIISQTLYYIGLTSLCHKIGNRGTIILVYHRVLDIKPEFDLDPGLVSASVSNFEKQMEHLSNKYNVISLEKFLEYHKKKTNPPKNSVVITFDDGYKDNYDNAYPMLNKYRLPATVFLTTAAIDKQRMFWWDQLAYMIYHTKVEHFNLNGFGSYSLKSRKQKALNQIRCKVKQKNTKNRLIKKLSSILKVKLPDKIENLFMSWDEINSMSKNNISFGSHTTTHQILTKIPIKDAENEIVISKNKIEKILNKKVTLFSYPNGMHSDFNSQIKNILKKNGFHCALTYLPGINSINSDLFELKRVFVRYDEDIIMFKNKLIGVDSILSNIYFIISNFKNKLLRAIC